MSESAAPSRDWTKVSFDELADSSPADAPMRWLFARDAMESRELGISRFTFEPGSRMPWGHRHREQEEAYVVIAGSGRMKLDDAWVDLVPGDIVRVAPQVGRGLEAGSEGLDVICVGTSRPAGNDGERVDGFWADGASTAR